MPPTPTPTPTPDEDRITQAKIRQFTNLARGSDWRTDFSKRSVPLIEIDNNLPRDAIRPIDDPSYWDVADPAAYLRDEEPVISVEVNGDARAFPLAIMMQHEIVNDVVGGTPVTVTFCPLCNTAIAFDRRVDGRELTFGTSGNLRNSDLVMWDRQTESWWQQITGEAIVGELTGTKLTFLQAPIISWAAFEAQFPAGRVLQRPSPTSRYDRSPYQGYDDIDKPPFLFRGETDGRLSATERVLTVDDGEAFVAYPFSFLQANTVINDTVGGIELTAFFDDGTFSAFQDGRGRAQTSGSTTVFIREVDGQSLTFERDGDSIRDLETGTVWSVTGTGQTGPLAGKRLEPVLHANHFWFAWAVFNPQTEVRGSTADLTIG